MRKAQGKIWLKEAGVALPVYCASEPALRRSQNLHKKISTHPLTVPIMRAILHVEQRKGIQREQRKRFPEIPEKSWFQRNKVKHREA